MREGERWREREIERERDREKGKGKRKCVEGNGERKMKRWERQESSHRK